MLEISQVIDVCRFGSNGNLLNYSFWPKVRKLDSKGHVTQVRQGISICINANTLDNRVVLEVSAPSDKPHLKGFKIHVTNVPPNLSKEDRLRWFIGFCVEEMSAFCRDLASSKKHKTEGEKDRYYYLFCKTWKRNRPTSTEDEMLEAFAADWEQLQTK